MTEQQARDAASDGRKVEITAGLDKGFRGTATRVFTVNREHYMHLKSRTKMRYAPIADVDLV